MNPIIQKIDNIDSQLPLLVFCHDLKRPWIDFFQDTELDYIMQKKDKEDQLIRFINPPKEKYFLQIKEQKGEAAMKEAYRKAGANFYKTIKNAPEIQLVDESEEGYGIYFAEGIALASYTFDKYKSDSKPKKLTKIWLMSEVLEREIELMNISNEACTRCRDLSNEPQQFLDAVRMSEIFKSWGKETYAAVEVYTKKKIESLKMGGLLAVNKGSQTPPTFTILTWKPENAVNEKPYLFVGKGVVFDTGGLNIKTGSYMYDMKMDMAGGAAVASAFWAVAKAKLPVYLIAFIPASDNRPGEKAYAPGDIIKMHSGKTVEVINTDAEGRMLLADALSYAKQYKPKMVIDVATLTGSAANALSKFATAAMGNDPEEMDVLEKSGYNVNERIVKLPMWEDYGELIQSDFADIKNLGGPEAGAITAGKFLEHFVDYPWVHLDIAGPSILSSAYSYLPKGGSGVGARLLFDFMRNLSES